MEKESSVQKYSKKASPVERYNAAQEIKAKRAEFFGRQQDLDRGLTESKTKQERIESIFQEIAELEEHQRRLEAGFLGKIVNFIALKNARAEIGALNSEVSHEELDQIRADISLFEAAKLDRHEIDEAKAVLSEFWEDQAQEFAEAEEEVKVDTISERYDALVVHTFSEFTPRSNSLLKEGLTWKEKAEIFLAFNPTVSCSGVTEGRRGMWSNVGVILSRGRIVQAGGGDGATVARGLKNRTDYNPIYRGKIKDQIMNAMKALPGYPNAYNELVVEDGQVAGIFYAEPKHIRTSGASFGEVIEFADELGIPFYFVRDGQCFARNDDGEVDFTRPVNRQMLMQKRPNLTEISKNLKKQYLDDVPFKNPEVVSDL